LKLVETYVPVDSSVKCNVVVFVRRWSGMSRSSRRHTGRNLVEAGDWLFVLLIRWICAKLRLMRPEHRQFRYKPENPRNPPDIIPAWPDMGEGM